MPPMRRGSRRCWSRAVPACLTCLAVLLAGCGRFGMPEVAMPGSGSKDMRSLVEDRAWIATDEEAAPGSMRIFMSDGTLVMTSCGETYRLAPWRWVEGTHLVWEEDGRSIRGEVVMAERRSLVLAIELGDDATVTQSYRAAVTPEVCPDLAR
jgi:hypothetical protein